MSYERAKTSYDLRPISDVTARPARKTDVARSCLDAAAG
jgi:hypothetical protein